MEDEKKNAEKPWAFLDELNKTYRPLPAGLLEGIVKQAEEKISKIKEGKVND
jgi:hypothetical protein